MHNASFVNYQAAIFGCAWCVAHRGGYEMEFWNVSMHNVDHVAHFKHGVGGILVDGDGSLGSGAPGGMIVPPSGQWRTNPNCTQNPDGRFTACLGAVRRVNIDIKQWRSPWWDTNIKKHYPLLITTDVTDEALDDNWDKWNRYQDQSRVSCLSGGDENKCGMENYATTIGANACYEQAPKSKYSFLAAVGRRYLITWVDQNFIRTTADVAISVTKMRPDEVMVLQFTHRPPLYPRLPMRAKVAQSSVELWGELPPRFGAWSPPPNIPLYAAELQDHQGDELADPCAKGTYVSIDHPGSCYKGENGGYNALELETDADVKVLAAGNLTLELKAEGRTDHGGLLHPASRDVSWGGVDVSEASATSTMYRAYCMETYGETDLAGDNPVRMNKCREEDVAQEQQRFKFG